MSVIYGLSSGAGKAGVAVIRISGDRTRQIVSALSGTVPEPRRASLRLLRDSGGEILDQAIVLWLPGPGSFTGEDCAEFHVHGSRAVIEAVFRELRTFSECRPAEAGEFSRRAFLNGRVDLIDLEGLADLIDSETEGQRRQALSQLDGRLRSRIDEWMTIALGLHAAVEAALDFSDEADVVVDLSETVTLCQQLAEQLEMTLLTTGAASPMRRGCRIGIIGPPNSGKSSLLNRLAGHDAAIVSDRPGTTRDVIEVRMDLGGLPVVFADSAGLRIPTDEIEEIGIERARDLAVAADIVIWLSVEEGPPDWLGSSRLFPVAAQRDRFLECEAPSWARMGVSSVSGEGLVALVDEIRRRAAIVLSSGGDLVLQDRQRALIESAAARLRLASRAQEPELIAEDLRGVRLCLAQAIGGQAATDVLDQIFSRFCIGK